MATLKNLEIFYDGYFELTKDHNYRMIYHSEELALNYFSGSPGSDYKDFISDIKKFKTNEIDSVYLSTLKFNIELLVREPQNLFYASISLQDIPHMKFMMEGLEMDFNNEDLDEFIIELEAENHII